MRSTSDRTDAFRVDTILAPDSGGNRYDDAGLSELRFWYQNSNNAASNVFGYPWTCGDEGNGRRDGDAGAVTPMSQASKRLRNA